MYHWQIVRRISSTPQLRTLVQPPVQVFGFEGRYATALYSAASKSNALPAVEKDLTLVKDALASDQRLFDFCLDRSLQRSLKAREFAKVLDKMKLSPLSKNMLIALAENGRLANIKSVLEKFDYIMTAHRGEVNCVVRTAKPLDKASDQELRTSLKGFINPNQTLKLTIEVDPSIIGGMIVSIGDRFIDMSVARKLRMYRKAMEEPL